MAYVAPAQAASSIADTYRLRHWGEADGLPDRTVQAILPTRDGYLWLATPYGVARYDGLRFVVFDHGNTPEMVSDNCTNLCEDHEGNLWVGTRSGPLRFGQGVSRFNLLTGEPDPHNQEVQAAAMRIYAVYCDQSGQVWVGTGGNLAIIDGGKIQQLSFAGDWENTKIRALHLGRDGSMWVGTVRGVHHG